MPTHGCARVGATTPEYKLWAGMIQRCYNPKRNVYRYYGGRGVQVCERWRRSFAAFLEDMGLRPSSFHSLDRINGDGDYEPANVRWATAIEQHRNRRKPRMVTAFGETRCVAEWSELLGVNRYTIYKRLDKGWSGESALGAPQKEARR